MCFYIYISIYKIIFYFIGNIIQNVPRSGPPPLKIYISTRGIINRGVFSSGLYSGQDFAIFSQPARMRCNSVGGWYTGTVITGLLCTEFMLAFMKGFWSGRYCSIPFKSRSSVTGNFIPAPLLRGIRLIIVRRPCETHPPLRPFGWTSWLNFFRVENERKFFVEMNIKLEREGVEEVEWEIGLLS